jgi:hypothetical protein
MAQRLKTYTFKMVAGEDIKQSIAGTMLHVLDSDDPVSVYIDDTEKLTLEKSLGIKTETPFKAFRLNSATTQTITIMVGFGDVIDGRTVLTPGAEVTVDSITDPVTVTGAVTVTGSATVSGTVKKRIPDTFANVSAKTVTGSTVLIIAANAKGQKITIRPTDGDILIGANGFNAADGMPVNQDEVFTIETMQAVYATRAGGTDVNTRVLIEAYT